MSERLGLYLCRGCGLGECLDVDALVPLGAAAAVVRTSPAFCLEDARQIGDDVASGKVDAAVIAACSPRVKTDVFAFSGAAVQRVDLREQVAWSHPPRQPETQALAADQVRMGLVRAGKIAAPAPAAASVANTVLVLGGGAAGIAAAAAAARYGCPVVLVERQPALGGYAAALHRDFARASAAALLPAPAIDAAVAELQRLANVRVLCGAEVSAIAGEPGQFTVTVQLAGGQETVAAGAIVVATGWAPPDDTTYAAYGLGRFANVVRSADIERLARAGAIRRPSDGQPVRSAALLLCDSAADAAHAPFAGPVASLVALKQALYFREQAPETTVYLLYRNLHTPGTAEYFYRRVQRSGVLFSQAEVTAVSECPDGRIAIETADSVLGGGLRIEVDLAVVSTDMRPATGAESGSLHLAYLQGSDLPTNPAGFADSHFICFPYETRRTGIYTAGAVRRPMDLAAAEQDGAAAALKAVQCIQQSRAGAAVHPRVGDLTYPEFFLQKCTSCGRCTQECPFGALELGEKNRPVLDVNRCRRCGICMGACPVQIISFRDYSVDMLSAMIKAVEIPEGEDDKPRVLVFACENDAYPALDMAGWARRAGSLAGSDAPAAASIPASVRILPVRCLGSVNAILVADAVARGFDGVALLGCRSGDNYQCHFIRGSELLGTRMRNIRETLDRLALEAERVRVIEVSIADAPRLPALLDDFVADIRRIGPNPMKGF